MGCLCREWCCKSVVTRRQILGRNIKEEEFRANNPEGENWHIIYKKSRNQCDALIRSLFTYLGGLVFEESAPKA